MKIKAKIRLGVSFLFAMVVLLGGLSIYYLSVLKQEAAAVLKDNNETLGYLGRISHLLNTQAVSPVQLQQIDILLKKQEQNITEVGEAAATAKMRRSFEAFRLTQQPQYLQAFKQAIDEVGEINRMALVRKNDQAQQTAENAVNILKYISIVCLLISFTFILNFPSFVADPILQLTAGIQHITMKNYEQRLHFSSNDEFGALAKAFNTMAEKLDEYEHSNLAKILFEKKRTEALIDHLNDAVIGLDATQHILFVNKVALDLLHLKAEDTLGKYAPDIALYNDLFRTILPDKGQEQPLKIYANERENYFTKESIAIQNDDTLVGKVILLKNITHFHELDEAKTNFIATISHELKTPIAGIKMSLMLLENAKIGTLNPEQQELVAHIKADTQRLLRMTGELLDLTQLESGKIQLQVTAVNPTQMIAYALGAVEQQAQMQDLSLVVELPESLPWVAADAEKTAWVLVNLLTNAMRYSHSQGKIIIAAQCQREQVIFSVQDFGKGIDEAYQAKIFDKYFQTPNSQAGTGLGLAISKQFIEAQQGKIWVESKLGEGAKFMFSLQQVKGNL